MTWVTLALTAGVPMELVRRVTGHATADIVLKHYFRPGREEFRQALEAAMPGLALERHDTATGQGAGGSGRHDGGDVGGGPRPTAGATRADRVAWGRTCLCGPYSAALHMPRLLACRLGFHELATRLPRLAPATVRGPLRFWVRFATPEGPGLLGVGTQLMGHQAVPGILPP